MPITLDKKKLVAEVLDGNVAAGVELARKTGCDTVSDLLRQIDPLMRPSVGLCDTCADAMALVRETRARSERPTVEIKTP